MMDGIPVKISEKYKPPKKITLPGSIINRLNTEMSVPVYDFQLERTMVDKIGEWRQLRKRNVEARRQRIDVDEQTRKATESVNQVNLGPPDPPESVGSKSVPDIVQELELELKDKRAAKTKKSTLEQPQRPASIGPTEALKQTKVCQGTELKRRHASSLPNPFYTLEPACQRLASRLAEMGFSLPRAARAVQMFGDDETRVLEFLLQVQTLEEKNYPADRVEKALVVNKFNESETVLYLDTMQQLLDLGFHEEKIVQALARFGNDRDKVLDSLIS